MGVEINGMQDTLAELDELKRDFTGGGEWVVGTAVEYAIYLEFGTSKMDPKPFFRPALREVRTRGVEGFVESNSDTSIESIDSAEELVQTLAFALERRIKEIITRKTLVDTGTLRASVLAVPLGGVDNLPGEDEFSGFDSDNPAPPTAGRATVNIDT